MLIIFLSGFHVYNENRNEAVKFNKYLFFSVFKKGQINLSFNSNDSTPNGKSFELQIWSEEIRFRVNTTMNFHELVSISQKDNNHLVAEKIKC